MGKASERTPLRCEATQKILAKTDGQGLWFWCRNCHQEHFVAWSKLPIPKPVSETAFLLNALTQ